MASLRMGGLRRLLSTKASTKLVGVPVVPDALPVLKGLCEQQLAAVQVLPTGIPYRTDLEKFSRTVIAAVDASATVSELEAKLGLGEAEEVIGMIKGELDLIPKYAAWRAWEVPEGPEKDRLDAHKQTVLDSLKDRGAAIRRLDIPMREPSVDFPVAANVSLREYTPPEPAEGKK